MTCRKPPMTLWPATSNVWDLRPVQSNNLGPRVTKGSPRGFQDHGFLRILRMWRAIFSICFEVMNYVVFMVFVKWPRWSDDPGFQWISRILSRLSASRSGFLIWFKLLQLQNQQRIKNKAVGKEQNMLWIECKKYMLSYKGFAFGPYFSIFFWSSKI